MIGMFFLVCMAIIITVLVGKGEEKPEEVARTTTTLPSQPRTPLASNTTDKDTGFTEAKPRRGGRGSRGGGSRGDRRDRKDKDPKDKDPKAKPDKPSAGRGKVVIRIRDAAMATKAELVCPGGYRERSSFRSQVASFTGVPGGACTVYFKGALAAKYQGVKSGDSLTCYINGRTAQCK